jgi:hypothetical protein
VCWTPGGTSCSRGIRGRNTATGSRKAANWEQRRGHQPGPVQRPPLAQERAALWPMHDFVRWAGEAHRAAKSTARPGERHGEVLVNGCAPNNSPGPTRPRTQSSGGPSRRRSSRCCHPARPRRSSDSARRLGSGRRRSCPTSTPVPRTTAAPKRSTASSNATATLPPASATGSTTNYACSSSAADGPTLASGRKTSSRF